MAVTTRSPQQDTVGRHDRDPQPSRLHQWWASWRVALRLARRDVRRHRGRNALIVLMVGLPVALLVAGTTLYASDQIQGAERIPFAMGASQALLTPDVQSAVAQQPDGRLAGSGDAAVTPIPGWAKGSEVPALEALTGGKVSPVTSGQIRVRVGKKVVAATTLGVDAAAAPYAAGLVTLTSGRWPSTATELVVTPTGAKKGLPDSGTVTAVLPTGSTTAYTVVGTGTGYLDRFGTPEAVDMVTLPSRPAGEAAEESFPGVVGNTSYLLDRPAPVTWAEVQRLNAYGILVVSRAVLTDPPPASETPIPADDNAGTELAVVGMLAVALLILTTLLAGPAFAVSAARQRRTLALAASNGATQAQLRRTVLAQALVLGALAAVVCGGAGVLGALIGQRIGHAMRPWRLFGPFDVPWTQVGLVVGAAIVSSVVASLLPARGLARIDVVAAIRGVTTPHPIKRRVPWIGLLVLAVGAATTLYAGLPRELADPNDPNSHNADALYGWVMVGGAVLLVIGALMLVPALLLGVARASSRMPFWVRMATRDSARQRGRATATVAAILGGSAVLSTALVVIASQGAYNEKHYTPRLPAGTGSVYAPDLGGPGGSARSATQIRDITASVAPDLRVSVRGVVDFPGNWRQVSDGGFSGAPVTQQIQALRAGCPVDQLTQAMSTGFTGENDPCLSIGTQGWGGGSITVLEPGDLARLMPLAPRQVAAVAAGAVVVAENGPTPTSPSRNGPPPSVVDVTDGTVTFVTVRRQESSSDQPSTVSLERTQKVPAVVVPRTVMQAAFPQELVGGVMTTSTARALGWTVVPSQVMLQDPRGPISADDQQRLQDSLQEQLGDATVYVERGYQPVDMVYIVVGLGLVSLIILVATLIATVLSQTEAAPLMGTLAAVGATRGTRRAWAAASAGSLALVGAVVGIVVGLVPGIALAVTTTGTDWVDNLRTTITPTIVLPLLPLLVVAIAVPLLAAGIAWVCVRRAPTMTRRLG